jgi:hypothetical protein
MRKMYNNPKTEVLPVNTEYVMQGLTLSADGNGSGVTEAPVRNVAPVVPGEGL